MYIKKLHLTKLNLSITSTLNAIKGFHKMINRELQLQHTYFFKIQIPVKLSQMNVFVFFLFTIAQSVNISYIAEERHRS